MPCRGGQNHYRGGHLPATVSLSQPVRRNLFPVGILRPTPNRHPQSRSRLLLAMSLASALLWVERAIPWCSRRCCAGNDVSHRNEGVCNDSCR